MKKAGKIFGYVLTTLLILIVLASTGLVLTGRRSSDKIPTIAGRKVLNVMSGSMQPAIHTGDAIVIQPLPAGELPKEGDVITFKAQTKDQDKEMLVTHRIVGTVLVNDKPAAFVTKGDANGSDDLGTVSPDRIVGVYRFRVPLFGYIAYFGQKPFGILLLVVVPGLLVIAEEIWKVVRIIKEDEEAKATAKAPASGGEQSL